MSKTIKITDEVYTNLEAIREKRETFSDVVERLIDLHTMLKDVTKTLGPSHYLNKRPEDPLRKAMLERADLDKRLLQRPNKEGGA